MLTLTIEKKWFDMILSGEKTEEYRELKRYYDSRFRNAAMLKNQEYQASVSEFRNLAATVDQDIGNCFPHMCVDVEKFKKRDSVQAFLHETYKLVCGIAQAPRPHIFCKDGFEMSVQAGDGLYCEPRVNLESGEYATCEVGYPSQKEELLMPYIEDPTEPTKAVYPYVPVEVIEQVIEKHGGWFDARIPFA